MINQSFHTDLRLKAIVQQPNKPTFAWDLAAEHLSPVVPQIQVAVQGHTIPLTAYYLAHVVGDAVRDTALAAGADPAEIFTEAQQNRVVGIISDVLGSAMMLQLPSGSTVDESTLYVLIERVLIEHQEGNLATALIYQRGRNSSATPQGLPRVIRRNHKLADWNTSKIEVAVAKAFYGLNYDPGATPSTVANAVSLRVQGMAQPFIYIEEVQDIVQEELMSQFARTGDQHLSRVVQAYITFRNLRSLDRAKEEEALPVVVDSRQQENLVILRAKDSILWDGEDLRARIKFASIGLNIAMDPQQIEQELRRALFTEISEADLRKTIILNAKSLIERDPDFTKFAARILLTYIYEEVLDWDIVADGVEKLKEAHRNWFLKYIPTGIKIERLSPLLATTYNLQDLADSLDPMSDLEFDYLGIQTLYDRYLIVDKTGAVDRRMETPQIFWMRVAMGLFLEEPKEKRNELVRQLYTMYRTRRFCSSTPTLFNSGTLHSQLSSCFPADTPIITKAGFKRIADISTADAVLTAAGQYQRVLAVAAKNPTAPLRAITLKGFLPGEAVISPTADHRLLAIAEKDIECIRQTNNGNAAVCLSKRGQHTNCHKRPRYFAADCPKLSTTPVLNGAWTAAKDLLVGDYIAVTYPKVEKSATYSLLDYLDNNLYGMEGTLVGKLHKDTKRHYSGTLHTQTKSLTNCVPLTADLALFFGYYAAEGYASDLVAFTFNRSEVTYIKEVIDLGERLFGITPSVEESAAGQWTQICFHSIILAEFFRAVVGGNGASMRVPAAILEANQDIARQFICGFFRGDGGVIEGVQYGATVSNKELSFNVTQLCLKCGALPLWRKSFRNHLATRDPYSIILTLNNDNGLISQIGKDITTMEPDLTPTGQWRVDGTRFWGTDGLAYYRIDAISEQISSDKVWDIQVETDESFSAMGIAAHNCYLYKVDDTIESIMYRGIAENAFLSKWAGGLGGSWTAVRGTGANIKGTNGESQGVIPFLKLHNDQLVAVNQCFAGDTLIPTQRGFTRIADVIVGDIVLTEDGTYRPVKEALRYFQSGKPMISLSLKHSGGAIEVTTEHPLYALQGVPRETAYSRVAKALAKGTITPSWVDSGKLSVGDFVAMGIPLELVDQPDFTPADARFYGALLGNGHTVKDRNEWGLTCNLNSVAGQETMAFARTYLDARGIHHWGEPIHGGTDILRWTMTTETFLTEDDLYDAGGNKRIHPRFMHLPQPKTLALVQGLLRTDGGLGRENDLCFYSTSQQLAEGIRYCLLRLRVPTHTIEVFSGTSTEYCVRIPLVEAIAAIVGVQPITKRNWLEIDNKLFTRVTGVTNIPPAEFVYDLKVDGPASYCTTSALAHNGGKRRGSGCAYLEVWHTDIFEFLELRKNVGDDRRRTHDMNTANWIPDLFMKRMEARAHWTLFRSNQVPDLHELYGKKFEEAYVRYEQLAAEGKIYGEKIEALDLWKKMLSVLFETGHPWITFKDPCNVRSPQDHAGVIHSSNLCTEITLNTSAEETAVCNLGSIVLENHLTSDGKLDRTKLAETIRVAVRALDNVIDINFYPTVAAKTSNLRHRPIGLGVMGLGNALNIKNVPFDCQEAVEFSDQMMEAIAYEAYLSSSLLAKEKATYSSYKGSKWDRGLLPQDTLALLEAERGLPLSTAASIRAGKPAPMPSGGQLDWTPVREHIAQYGMRNSNVLAIAPTATISNIMASSPCIEPLYKQLFVKSNLSGEFIVPNPYLGAALKALNLWDDAMVDQLKYFDGSLQKIDNIPDSIKRVYKTVFDIDFEWVIDAAARRQKWIDQAQSVNLYLAAPDLKVLSHMYRAAWHSGLKTTYYLRSLGASSIEKATVSAPKTRQLDKAPSAVPPTPQECESCT